MLAAQNKYKNEANIFISSTNAYYSIDLACMIFLSFYLVFSIVKIVLEILENDVKIHKKYDEISSINEQTN